MSSAEHLRAIVYVSAAVRPLTQSELDHLLTRARERNRDCGVTGLLLHSAGSFMQYVEGPGDELKKIYAIILADPLHSDIRSLMDAPIAEREFADWSMAFNWISAPTFLRLTRSPWTGNPTPADLSPGRELLRQVWQHQRG